MPALAHPILLVTQLRVCLIMITTAKSCDGFQEPYLRPFYHLVCRVVNKLPVLWPVGNIETRKDPLFPNVVSNVPSELNLLRANAALPDPITPSDPPTIIFSSGSTRVEDAEVEPEKGLITKLPFPKELSMLPLVFNLTIKVDPAVFGNTGGSVYSPPAMTTLPSDCKATSTSPIAFPNVT
jgi:hypothetical protein